MKREEKRKQEAITVPRMRRARPVSIPVEAATEPQLPCAIREEVEADLRRDDRFER